MNLTTEIFLVKVTESKFQFLLKKKNSANSLKLINHIS